MTLMSDREIVQPGLPGNADTSGSEAWFERAKRVLAAASARRPGRRRRASGNYPLTSLAAGAGACGDVDGNELVDFLLSYGSRLGHCDRVSRSRHLQLESGTMYGNVQHGEVELAEHICKDGPVRQARAVRQHGSEAICGAIRAAARVHRAKQDPQVRGALSRLGVRAGDQQSADR